MPNVHCAHDRMVALADLIPNPQNANLHPTKQIELLGKIIEATGWRSPITVSTRSGMIVRGHGRYAAARLCGFDPVPVDFQDYQTASEELQDLLADNQIAELSSIDEDLLKEILKDIDPLAVELTGFDPDYVEKLLARMESDELKEEIVTEQEYQDARNTADRIIETLTDKVRHLAETDPRRLNDAIAIVVPKGHGTKTLFFLADPNTLDAATELQRLAAAGEHSPLEAIMGNWAE